MKVKDIPFNMDHSIDENLLEKPVDFKQMQQGVDFLIDESSKLTSPIEKGQVASMVGVYSRILGDLEVSESFLNEAWGHFQRADKTLMANYVQSRLATTLYYAGKYTPSDQKFEQCLKALEGAGELAGKEKIVVYCLDHWGRSKYIRKFYNSSLNLFLEAHEAEIIHGDMDSINRLSDFIAKLKTIVKSENV